MEVKPGVLRRSAVLVNELLPKVVLDFDEIRLVVRGRETLDQLLNGRREPVEGFVTRSPESITAGIRGGLDDLQNGIVGRNMLKGDTAARGQLLICCVDIKDSGPGGGDLLSMPTLAG